MVCEPRPQRLQQLELRLERAVLDSQQSLELFLRHVVIDARPAARAFGLCCEPWQARLVASIAPAVECIAGVRPDYHGPRSFYFVLPRGHDKTGLVGRLVNWAVAFSRQPICAIAAAAKQDQAALLLASMKAEIDLNPWLAERLRVYSDAVVGPGGVLRVISAEANTASGLKADLIVCDELTFWRGRALFDVLFSGREKRSQSVFIIITNAGVAGSWQHALLQAARADRRHWCVYEAPVNTLLATWMNPARIAAMRAMIPRGHARRVFDNQWIDRSEAPLLPFELIQQCVAAGCLWNAGAELNRQAELYLGVDIGRTRDRTVIWTIERLGDVAWTREIKVLHDTPFARQKFEIRNRIVRQVCGALIDKGAIGCQLAEELEAEFPHVVAGVQLNPARQGRLALAFKTACETRHIRLPDDAELFADLQLVEQVETGAQGFPVIKTHRGETGHADRFWAGALALAAMPLDRPRLCPAPQGRRSEHG